MKPLQFVQSQNCNSSNNSESILPKHISNKHVATHEIPVNKSKYQKTEATPQIRNAKPKVIKPNVYKNLILYETAVALDQGSFQLIQISVNKQQGNISVEYSDLGQRDQIQCKVTVNGVYAAEATASNKKDVRTLACDLALKTLRSVCYTIKTKDTSSSSIKIDVKCGKNEETTPNNDDKSYGNNKLTEENKGFKMMKMLGWSGGALGVGGIEEPVSIQLKVDRKGLGLGPNTEPNNKLNHRFFADYLQKYRMDTHNIHELVFSTEYTKEERAALHSIAAKQGLKSNSKNTADGERYLIISKKIPLSVLANNILNGGIYTEMYELVPPTNL